MKIAIQVSARDSAKALEVLVRHSAGMALPNRIYVVSEDAVKELRKKRVQFKEITREGVPPTLNGAVKGERI